MEAYGDQAAATNKPFCCKSKEEPMARSNRGQLILATIFKMDRSVLTVCNNSFVQVHHKSWSLKHIFY